MTLFFDRSMGRKIPQALQLLGVDAIAHDDRFGPRTPDDVWLAAAGQRGWTVVTKDDRIRFNQAERVALVTYRVGCFVLLRRNATRWQLTQIRARAWDEIETIGSAEPRPFLYAIYADGSVNRRSLSS